MKITWLGQAGFLFENENVKIIIDPYLSESCLKLNKNNFRRFPVDENFLKIKPDIIILTHNHLDHTDPDTLKHYINEDSAVTVLASENAWNAVRVMGGNNNYVMFNEGTEFTEKGITFRAVYANHSDSAAIGVVFECEGKTYYITGDTLYNNKIFDSLAIKPDVVFLPVNGVGNNMNLYDACRFVDKIGAKAAVPCHFGLHDDLSAEDIQKDNNFFVPTPFKEIKF